MSAASQAAAEECAAVHPRRVKKRELGRDKKGHLNAAGPASGGERSFGYDPHFFFSSKKEKRAPRLAGVTFAPGNCHFLAPEQSYFC